MIFSLIASGIPMPLSFTLITTCPFSERCGYRYFRLIIRPGCFLLLIYRIKSIIKQVKQYPANILRYHVYFWQFLIKMGYHFGVESFVFCPQTMIGQAHIFIRQRINIGWFFCAAAGLAVLQHAFYNSVGAFAVWFIFSQFCLTSSAIAIASSISPFLISSFHFVDQFHAYLREIIDEI